MNSDLVYKKKYLKYKSKYIALQRQLYAQEGGWPSFTTFSTKSKLGIYLFFINNAEKYDKLLDRMNLLKEVYFKDSGSEISNVLGEKCYYVERKTNIIDSGTKGEGRISLTFNKLFTLKSCKGDQDIPFKDVEFSDKNVNIDSLKDILSAISSKLNYITHYFIVDYNALKYNRISCLFKMPDPQATAPELEQYQLQQQQQQQQQQYQQQQQQQQYQQQQPGQYPPPPGYGAAPPPGYGAAPPPGYGAAPPPGYGAPPPGYGAPPQATAPLEELSQQQLAQLKPKYYNLTDLQLQQGWQQYKSKDPNISSQDFVYRMLQPST